MKNILIIGAGSAGITTLTAAMLKEEYGQDIKLFTPEEAQLAGLMPQDFDNVPVYEIKAPPKFEDELISVKQYFNGGQRQGKGGRARNRSKFNKRK
jgi:hypothetical protein